jgi:porin
MSPNRSLVFVVLMLALLSAAAAQSNSLDAAFQSLDRRGLSLSLQLYLDTLAGSRANPASPNSTAFQYVDVSTTLDLGRLSPRLSGTHLFASIHVNGSYAADFGGALQSFSGIATPAGTRLAEFWIEHRLGKSAQLRIGKVDANPDFAFVETASGFLNSAISYDPTSITLPNYSETRWGGELLLQHGHFRTNLAAFSPADGTGCLLMEEIGAAWQPADWNGRIALGAWQRTGKMASFSSLNESGAKGAYLTGEQKMWRHTRDNGKAEQSLSAYVQLGYAPSAFSALVRHVGAGVVWNAPLARRDGDSAGFAITRGRFTNHPAAEFDQSHETVVETYYRLQLSKQLSVLPDFQYAINPGGLTSNRNTYAVGARIIFSLNSHAE